MAKFSDENPRTRCRFVSKPRSVRDKAAVFLLHRPEILPYIIDARVTGLGMYVVCTGPGEELVKLGLVEAWMLDGLVKPRQRSVVDGNGNKYTVIAKARGHFEVMIRTDNDDEWDLNSAQTRKLKWFRDNGAALDATVAAILERFAGRVSGAGESSHA